MSVSQDTSFQPFCVAAVMLDTRTAPVEWLMMLASLVWTRPSSPMASGSTAGTVTENAWTFVHRA